jgi:hypothetical protein
MNERLGIEARLVREPEPFPGHRRSPLLGVEIEILDHVIGNRAQLPAHTLGPREGIAQKSFARRFPDVKTIAGLPVSRVPACSRARAAGPEPS